MTNNRSIALLCALALVVSLFLVMFSGTPVEAGKKSKRMMAMAILSMLHRNQKIVIPFPVPMPIKVYEKKEPYYYPKEEYPTHHYGDEGYGSHHGGHHHHDLGHGAFGGIGGLDGGHHHHAFGGGHHAIHTPSYNAHSMVNAYDGKVDGGSENEYGGAYANEAKQVEGGVSESYGGSDVGGY